MVMVILLMLIGYSTIYLLSWLELVGINCFPHFPCLSPFTLLFCAATICMVTNAIYPVRLTSCWDFCKRNGN